MLHTPVAPLPARNTHWAKTPLTQSTRRKVISALYAPVFSPASAWYNTHIALYKNLYEYCALARSPIICIYRPCNRALAAGQRCIMEKGCSPGASFNEPFELLGVRSYKRLGWWLVRNIFLLTCSIIRGGGTVRCLGYWVYRLGMIFWRVFNKQRVLFKRDGMG